jgi:hypothetical protein
VVNYFAIREIFNFFHTVEFHTRHNIILLVAGHCQLLFYETNEWFSLFVALITEADAGNFLSYKTLL